MIGLTERESMTRRFVQHDGSRKGCLAHRSYALTCGQYESLRERCGDRCELCGLPGAQSDWAKLAIDHHASVGQWAVRGLLCTGCNTNMRRVPDGDEQLQTFIDQSWFLGELHRLGLRVGEYPQPRIGTVIASPLGRTWRRYRSGWIHLNPYHRNGGSQLPAQWDRLVYQYGPINLGLGGAP
jgi:hypothetical protein